MFATLYIYISRSASAALLTAVEAAGSGRRCVLVRMIDILSLTGVDWTHGWKVCVMLLAPIVDVRRRTLPPRVL